MCFEIKNTLKNNHYHTLKQPRQNNIMNGSHDRKETWFWYSRTSKGGVFLYIYIKKKIYMHKMHIKWSNKVEKQNESGYIK
jgi:hypothetical protein